MSGIVTCPSIANFSLKDKNDENSIPVVAKTKKTLETTLFVCGEAAAYPTATVGSISHVHIGVVSLL
jgi:hypothetical protein